MKNLNRILWGIVLVFVGVMIGLKALDIIQFDIFFDGWWTLFIIVPCLAGLFGKKNKPLYIAGLITGVILLLACLDVISFGMILKLILPVCIVIAGIMLIFKDSFNKKAKEAITRINERGYEKKQCFAAFSEQNVTFNGADFHGAQLSAVFGGVECDIRGALLTEDTVINVNCIFGGIDIFVPDNIDVKVCTVNIFGGASDKSRHTAVPGTPTLYVTGYCVFGGVDIK